MGFLKPFRLIFVYTDEDNKKEGIDYGRYEAV